MTELDYDAAIMWARAYSGDDRQSSAPERNAAQVLLDALAAKERAQADDPMCQGCASKSGISCLATAGLCGKCWLEMRAVQDDLRAKLAEARDLISECVSDIDADYGPQDLTPDALDFRCRLVNFLAATSRDSP